MSNSTAAKRGGPRRRGHRNGRRAGWQEIKGYLDAWERPGPVGGYGAPRRRRGRGRGAFVRALRGGGGWGGLMHRALAFTPSQARGAPLPHSAAAWAALAAGRRGSARRPSGAGLDLGWQRQPKSDAPFGAAVVGGAHAPGACVYPKPRRIRLAHPLGCRTRLGLHCQPKSQPSSTGSPLAGAARI